MSNQPSPRVALGSIFVECNQLGGQPTDLARFQDYEFRRGTEVLALADGAVGGMLAVLAERNATPRPLLVASTCSGGSVTADCYRQLKDELIERLAAELPVGAVLLALHGSGAVEGIGDLEGDLLRNVRALVGPELPIVATLDLHAHVTADMVQNANGLVAWETYPHQDAFTTGRRGADLLLNIVEGRCRPTMVMAKVPVIVGACLGHTEGKGPFADLMRYAKSFEGKDGVLSTGAFMVHPNLNLPDLGSGGLVITDNDPAKAEALAVDIAMRYWARRFDLECDTFTPADAIRKGLQVAGGPVLLVETADCAGGGAAGDSVHGLRALLEHAPDQPSLTMLVDPEAAKQCHQAGAGATVDLELGHKLDPQWGTPIRVRGTILKTSEGRFQYTGGIWAGTWASMGPSAVVQIKGVKVLIASTATYDWADEQYRCMELDPAAAKFVVAKNPMNYRFGYAAISKAAFILDTPGPTPPTMKHVKLTKLARPYFPLDPEIPGLRPTVHRSASCNR